ncbi:MAG TPA: ROK family glucokinase [Mycobacteriales bacterium]|jgi:glucokinase|nr:ROK family glucokinase [Mycobacteriales bacterium]
MASTLTIGVDVGGTKVAAGLVDAEGQVLARRSQQTPSTSPTKVVEVVAQVVAELRDDQAADGHQIEAVGLGAAGFVDADRSTVLFAPNLAWRDEPLRELLAERVGLPVVVENDANAMAWGEYRFGAGRGVDDLVCLTVGTGIGGGLVLGGVLRRGAFGIGAEFGHLRMVPSGRRCGCGNRGCWEQYCSGRALIREARDLAVVSPDAAGRMLELADDEVDNITGQIVTRAGQEGDLGALDCFAQIGGWLGQGLADLAALLDPARFVIGGGVSGAGELLLGPARQAFERALTGHGHRPIAEVVAAQLGSSAGLVGAADLARRR